MGPRNLNDSQLRWRFAVLWWFAGGIASFGVIALLGVGLIALPVGVGLLLLLVVFRAPGAWMAPAGAATVAAVLFARLLVNPDAPNDEVLPVLISGVVAILAYAMHFRNR